MTLTNFALIGLGSMGSIHKKSIDENKNFKLDAVYEVDKNKVLSLKNKTNVFSDYKKFLNYISNNIDGVIISSPNKFHFKQAVDCIKLKIPVLVEKQITDSTEKMEKLLNISKEYNTILRCGLIETYNPIINELKKINFKNLKSIHITRHSPGVSSERNLGNVMIDLLLHDSSLLFNVFKPKNVKVVGFNKIKTKTNVETIEILLKINNKTSVFISTSRESQSKKRSIEIIDDKTIYNVDLIQKIIYVTEKGSVIGSKSTLKEVKKSYKIEPLDRPETAKIQLEAFSDNIKNKKIDEKHFKLIRDSHQFVHQFV